MLCIAHYNKQQKRWQQQQKRNRIRAEEKMDVLGDVYISHRNKWDVGWSPLSFRSQIYRVGNAYYELVQHRRVGIAQHYLSLLSNIHRINDSIWTATVKGRIGSGRSGAGGRTEQARTSGGCTMLRCSKAPLQAHHTTMVTRHSRER